MAKCFFVHLNLVLFYFRFLITVLATFPINITFLFPSVPFSTVSINGGMYVCRYAYAIYLMRNRRLTYRTAGVEDPPPFFRHLITNSPEFNFGPEDIKNMGQEMKTLVGRLSNMYLDTCSSKGD
jgi:hypothetical protein